MNGEQTTFLDRGDNPLFGGFQASNVVEGTIVKVHTDEANNVTMTCDVVTIKNETKTRVPLSFPYASSDGSAGIYAIPNVGDKCLVALVAGNMAYVVGYHPAGQLTQGRASAALASSGTDGQSLKGGFASGQLIPGAIEVRSPAGNRVMVHPGGSIAIDARKDLFTFYDAISSTVETLSRQSKTFTAGGQILWTEGLEKSKRSMSLAGTFYTKSATRENLNAGPLRDGARMTMLFSEQANHFFIEVTDKDDITSRISIGPNGIILTSSDGTNQGSISVGPSGSFSFIAGDPLGDHTQLDLAPGTAALSALSGVVLKASVQVNTTAGTAVVTAATKVTVDAPIVETTKMTQLALGGLGVARLQSLVQVDGVTNGGGSAVGRVITTSNRVQAGL